MPIWQTFSLLLNFLQSTENNSSLVLQNWDHLSLFSLQTEPRENKRNQTLTPIFHSLLSLSCDNEEIRRSLFPSRTSLERRRSQTTTQALILTVVCKMWKRDKPANDDQPSHTSNHTRRKEHEISMDKENSLSLTPFVLSLGLQVTSV